MCGGRKALVFIFLLAGMLASAYGLPYVYWTHREITLFGDRIVFRHGDTLDGPVHSNGQIAIMQDPVFTDLVTTSAADFWRGEGYSPQFLGPPPQFHVSPRYSEPWGQTLRQCAAQQQHVFGDARRHMLADFRGSTARIYQWRRGTPCDSTDVREIVLTENTCLFFDCVVRVQGRVDGRVTVGSSHLIEIEDDLRYADADSFTGRPPQTSDNYLALYSEGDIKIRNTPANGRENSGGLGLEQTDPRFTGVVINAALWALNGSLTFEQQNDPDSGYVCDCAPDRRGILTVYGSVLQGQRGYLHRSNRGATGYLQSLHYDNRWSSVRAPGQPVNGPAVPDTLSFGDVPVGTAVWDTIEVAFSARYTLGAVYATYPYYAVRIPPYDGPRFNVPVRFTPPGVGNFPGVLYVSSGPEHVSVVLRGRGVPRPGPLSLEVAPNPFNLTTTIRFALPEAGDVELILYDVLGRAARDIRLPHAAAGEHAVAFDAAGLASGLYFARLTYRDQVQMRKLILLK